MHTKTIAEKYLVRKWPAVEVDLTDGISVTVLAEYFHGQPADLGWRETEMLRCASQEMLEVEWFVGHAVKNTLHSGLFFGGEFAHEQFLGPHPLIRRLVDQFVVARLEQ